MEENESVLDGETPVEDLHGNPATTAAPCLPGDRAGGGGSCADKHCPDDGWGTASLAGGRGSRDAKERRGSKKAATQAPLDPFSLLQRVDWSRRRGRHDRAGVPPAPRSDRWGGPRGLGELPSLSQGIKLPASLVESGHSRTRCLYRKVQRHQILHRFRQPGLRGAEGRQQRVRREQLHRVGCHGPMGQPGHEVLAAYRAGQGQRVTGYRP